MKSRKQYLLVGVSFVGILLATEANALIPVFDGSAVAELIAQVGEAEKAFALQVQQYITQAKQYIGDYFGWVTQAQQFATQLEQFYTEGLMLLNFAHHPTFGQAMGLMNQAGLGNSLPFSPYAMANLINGNSYGQGGFGAIDGVLNALSGLSNSAYTQNRIYTPTDGSWASAQLNANANSISGSQGIAMAAYNDYRAHEGVLPQLRANAAAADTMKDAADSSNMLLAETVWNLNQLGQQNAAAYFAAAQRDARTQRDEERLACELESFRQGGNACPTGANGGMAGGGGGPNGGTDTMPVPPVPPLAGVGGPIQGMQTPAPVPPVPVAQPPAFEQPAPPPAPNAPAPAPPPPQVQAGGVLQ